MKDSQPSKSNHLTLAYYIREFARQAAEIKKINRIAAPTLYWQAVGDIDVVLDGYNEWKKRHKMMMSA